MIQKERGTDRGMRKGTHTEGYRNRESDKSDTEGERPLLAAPLQPESFAWREAQTCNFH